MSAYRVAPPVDTDEVWWREAVAEACEEQRRETATGHCGFCGLTERGCLRRLRLLGWLGCAS